MTKAFFRVPSRNPSQGGPSPARSWLSQPLPGRQDPASPAERHGVRERTVGTHPPGPARGPPEAGSRTTSYPGQPALALAPATQGAKARTGLLSRGTAGTPSTGSLPR